MSLPEPEVLRARFQRVLPAVDFCSLRAVDERTEVIGVRNDVVDGVGETIDVGAMVTVVHGGGLGYAATADLSEAGLRQAVARARHWADVCAGAAVLDFSAVPQAHPRGEYRTPVTRAWSDMPLADRLALLMEVCQALGAEDDFIVERTASLMRVSTDSIYLTSGGGEVVQHTEALAPDAMVIAHKDGVTQRRGTGYRGVTRQGGLEVLDAVGFRDMAPRFHRQARELLDAPDCPEGSMHLLLAPDQMMLQIHESIGHPLELDRILGDERNYAGTSFVTPAMFGSYQYGSELLDVTFDPTVPDELGSYGFDDEGTPATRAHLIEKGRLVRPLGGVTSQARAGMAGVANARACSWNRPPIDRMANLNIEPGTASSEELVGQVERGVYMETNASWSIDDSRNKFQFGCEYGRLIVDGELAGVVRNPNYRGISATFWRNLVGVGDRSTFQVHGTPYCGKGEPNQVIRVGHASPTCLFAAVDVFGGHA